MKRSPFSLIAVLAACLIVSVGCRGKSVKEGETVYREGEAPITGVSAGDPEMNAAIQKAQDTLGDFIKELEKPGSREFFIKIKMADSEGSFEHIWADHVSLKGGTFHAKLGNEPYHLPGLKLGDPVTATKDQISDWMIVEGEDIKGGYTSKLLAERDAQTGK